MKLHTRLFLALVSGIVLGAALHSHADTPWIVALNVNVLRPIGQIFLRTIFMIVVPMVFSALVIGVYELGRGHEIAGQNTAAGSGGFFCFGDGNEPD